MANTHETTEDVIAEMRGIRVREFQEYADRIEAAHRRERGDAAKLREALRECAQYIACVGGIGVGEVTINDEVRLIPEELAQKAITALDATPRNCDRFATVDEARKAHEEYRGDYIMRASNKFDFPMKFEAWLFAPATEGGDK